jgi:hypothetical protein
LKLAGYFSAVSPEMGSLIRSATQAQKIPLKVIRDLVRPDQYAV